MKISAVALMIYDGKFLIGKAPNHDRWDFPKGEIGEFESPVEASIREAKEETGIQLKSFLSQFVYGIGPIDYLKNKKLFINVFRLTKRQAQTKLKCSSFYETNGKKYPELSEFKWITWDEKDDYLYHSLVKALKNYEYLGEIINEN